MKAIVAFILGCLVFIVLAGLSTWAAIVHLMDGKTADGVAVLAILVPCFLTAAILTGSYAGNGLAEGLGSHRKLKTEQQRHQLELMKMRHAQIEADVKRELEA